MLRAVESVLVKQKPNAPITRITSIEELQELIDCNNFPENVYFRITSNSVIDFSWWEIIMVIIRYYSVHELPQSKLIKLDPDFLVNQIAAMLTSGHCKPGLTLDFTEMNITANHLKILASALMSGRCPEFLTFRCNGHHFGNDGLVELSTALCNSKYLYGFKLYLENTGQNNESMLTLAKAIAADNLPRHLFLGLSNNKIGCNGIIALIDSLKVTGNSSKISIDITHNLIGNPGAEAIANGIIDGYWRLDDLFDAKFNQIGNTGAIALAAAVMRKRTLPRFTFNLSYNLIKDEGVAGIARLLMKPHPDNMAIDISHNKITNAGIKCLADALDSGRCAQGISFNITNIYAYDENQIHPHWKARLNSLMIKNTNRHNTVLRCIAFLQGSGQPDNIISLLNRDVLLLICANMYPFKKTVNPDGKQQPILFANRVYAFFRHIKDKRQSELSVPIGKQQHQAIF